VALAGGDPEGQHGTMAVTDQMDLGANPPLRATQGVVRWLLQPQCLRAGQGRRRLLLFFSRPPPPDWPE
jgi:hypothetical protein